MERRYVMQTRGWRYAALLFLIASAAAVAQELGHVSGAVLDYSGAVFATPSIKITFVSKIQSQDVVTKDGFYSIDLAPGVYEVTTPTGSLWYPVRRAPFTVTAHSTLTLNLVPPLRVAGAGISATGEFVDINPPPKYETIRDTPADALYVVIEFREKITSGAEGQYRYAAVSFDRYWISARDISVKRRGEVVVITAKGALIDDGKRRTASSGVTLIVANGVAKLAEGVEAAERLQRDR